MDPRGSPARRPPAERRAVGPNQGAELTKARGRPSLASPHAALDRAVSWAIRRNGGHLRVDPASPGDSFSEADLEGLLDDARRFDRVRGAGVFEPDDLLRRVVGGLFGVRQGGVGGRLACGPLVPEGWRAMRLRKLRAHRTLLDLEVRPRAEWVTIRLAVTFGPPLAVETWLPDRRVVRVAVDEIPMEASRAIFTASGEHEVVLFYG